MPVFDARPPRITNRQNQRVLLTRTVSAAVLLPRRRELGTLVFGSNRDVFPPDESGSEDLSAYGEGFYGMGYYGAG